MGMGLWEYADQVGKATRDKMRLNKLREEARRDQQKAKLREQKLKEERKRRGGLF